MSIPAELDPVARHEARLKQDHELTPDDRIREIVDFAERFEQSVVNRTVYQSEPEGGGYALSSCVRDDFFIPTGTAAHSIQLLMRRLNEEVDDRDIVLSAANFEDVQYAVEKISSLGERIKRDRHLQQDYSHVLEQILVSRSVLNKELNDLAERSVKVGPSLSERVFEVARFSEEFTELVLAGRVYENEANGGGYAVTSKVRPQYHVPTGTMPATVSGLLEEIHKRCVARDRTLEPYQLDMLEGAVAQFDRAARSIQSDFGLSSIYSGVAEYIAECEPAMRKTLDALKHHVKDTEGSPGYRF
ncbi:MAG: hypothetical protein RBR86_05985 [Pseudobdellovibrionaceae bacterium]|jgi:hypothetical protein|nr:hypothetical protein [Pseudobdellovibrionaceae bacterium]